MNRVIIEIFGLIIPCWFKISALQKPIPFAIVDQLKAVPGSSLPGQPFFIIEWNNNLEAK
jgi:hypothetical protein